MAGLGIGSWNLNADDGSTFTGGTIDNLTVTGASVFNTLYATSLSGGTIYSGGTDLWDIITGYVTPESTGYTFDSIGLAISDETTVLTSGTTKLSFRMPYNFQLTGITAYVRTSGSTSTIVDVNSGSTSLLLSAITIPTNEFYTVASNIVSTYSALTEHDVINVDINSAGTNAAGLKLWLEGYKLQTVLGAGGTGGGPSTFVQNGINTFTGGTTQYPSVNITAATLNNLTVSGNTSLNVLSASTIYSGGTNLTTIIQSIAASTPFSGGSTGNTGQFQKVYSSNDTWTAPTGVFSVVVEMWGGGGGGGAGFRTGTNALKGGGGGASGAYITGEISVVPGITYQIAIGSGGTPGYYVIVPGLPNVSVTGNSGGDTYFHTLRSPGGNAGNNSTDTISGIGGIAPYLSGFPSSDNVYQTEYFFARGYNGANQTPAGGSDSSGGNGGDVPMFGRAVFGPGTGGNTPNTVVSQVGGSATLFGGGGAGGTGYYLDGEAEAVGYSGGSGTAGLIILKWNAGSGTTYSNYFSGGTISGDTNVTGVFTAQTYYSGSTSLDSIFSRYAASSHTHTISDISNLQSSLGTKANLSGATFSGVTETGSLKLTTFNPSVPQIYADSDTNTGIMFDGPDVMSFHTAGAQRILINGAGQITNGSQLAGTGWETYLSGDTRLDYLSAITISANTFVSGSTTLDTIFNRYAYSSHTHNISDINNLLGSLNTKANLSGATFTGNVSAPIITATTYYSGSTTLQDIFGRYALSSHTHVISDINNLQGSLDSKINLTATTIAAPTISATTFTSGSTNLSSLFAPKTLIMPYEFVVACSDETTQITTGTSKITFLAPCSFTLTGSVASLSSSGSTLTTANVKKANTTIYSTKVTIDANEFDSTTAATPPVITGSTWSQYDRITIDIDGAGTGAKGLKILFTGTRNITT